MGAARCLVLAVAVVLAAGCGRKAAATSAEAGSDAAGVRTVVWDPDVRAKAIEAGADAIRRHECTRCHTIDALPAADRPLHCTGCHEWLKGLRPGDRQYAKIAEKYGAPVIERYQRNIRHLVQVPNLTKIGRRLRPDWIARYLAEPWDVRPALDESMIRHRLNEADLRAVVRYFAAVAETDDPFAPAWRPPDPPAPPPPDRVDRGKAMFLQRGCGACHTFGNVPTGATADQLRGAGLAAALAPNLRFVRERMLGATVVEWIVDPQKVEPGSLMPALGLGREEAALVRDFLFGADPMVRPRPEAAPAATLPPLVDRKVGWEEVKERVLGNVCVHCHMNDHEKDPGPGNQGGLGWKGTGLRMRTYETLVSGAVDDRGARYSVLVPRPGETVPPILQSMLRRRAEETRDRVAPLADHDRPGYPAAPPGMPMGLPSMTDEEIALLATWIAQGCPGPERVTGVDGVTDGYLVPDGPIRKNRGCELRLPDRRRPAWAADRPDAGPPP